MSIKFRSELRLDWVSRLAVIYLALPNFVFLTGWFSPVVALPMNLLGLLVAGDLVLDKHAEKKSAFNVRGAVLITIGVALIWASFGGAGHLMFANRDWQVRDAVLGDLVHSAWPAAYAGPNGELLLLRSAIGFYLVPALLGKTFGIWIVDAAMYLWTAAGTALFLLLLPTPRKTLLPLGVALLLVVMFGGMDLIGFALTDQPFRPFPQVVEWWGPYSYSSLSAQLFWAPNHTLPIWIITALLYKFWRHAAFWPLIILVTGLSLIWTPFASVGVLPFLLIAIFREVTERNIPNITAPIVIYSLVLSTIVGLFITLNLSGVPVHYPNQAIGDPANSYKFASASWRDYLVFVEMEFGILAIALIPKLRHLELYVVSVIVLCLLPIFAFGPSKDSMLRLSVTPLVVLLIFVLERVEEWSSQGSYPISAYLIGAILLCGLPSAISEIGRAILSPHVPSNYSLSLLEQQNGQVPPHYMAPQGNAWINRLMLAPHLVPTASER